MRKKNAVLSFLIVIVLIAVLSGCARTPEPAESASGTVASTTKLYATGQGFIILEDALIIKEVGSDGYGSLDISYDATADVMSRMEEVKLSDAEKREIEELLKSATLFRFEYDGAGTLKNEETVKITMQKSDAALRIEDLLYVSFFLTPSDDYSIPTTALMYTVHSLPIEAAFDPFNHLFISTNNSYSGTGTLDFYIEFMIGEVPVKWDVVHDGENGSISNGDVLTLTINETIDEKRFEQETGKKLLTQTTKYKVSELIEYAVDEKIFDNIKEHEHDVFRKVIEDWIVSGLNDGYAIPEGWSYETVGYMFFCNYSSETPDDYDGMLVGIFKIKDYTIPDGYHVFLGLKEKFAIHDDGLFVGNGELMPDSMVYYEKEMVRYDEKFGWLYNDPHNMGFLYEGIPYAGHKALDNTLNYVVQTYGHEYSYIYFTENLKEYAEQFTLSEVTQ